jgi:hypothetical protein
MGTIFYFFCSPYLNYGDYDSAEGSADQTFSVEWLP